MMKDRDDRAEAVGELLGLGTEVEVLGVTSEFACSRGLGLEAPLVEVVQAARSNMQKADPMRTRLTERI